MNPVVEPLATDTDGNPLLFYPRVIGFGGPIGCGKSTARVLAVDVIKEYRNFAYTMAFADELKRYATLLGWNGEKDSAGRAFLQQLGAAARAYDPDVWVKKLIEQAQQVVLRSEILVIDDVRYPNEADFCQRHGAVYFLGGREGVNDGIPGHESESQFGQMNFTGVIANTSTVADLRKKVEEVLINNDLIHVPDRTLTR